MTKKKELMWNLLAVLLGIGAIILVCCLSGCNAWNYDHKAYNPEGDMISHVSASRCA